MRAEPISPKGIPDQEAWKTAKDAKTPFTLMMQSRNSILRRLKSSMEHGLRPT